MGAKHVVPVRSTDSKDGWFGGCCHTAGLGQEEGRKPAVRVVEVVAGVRVAVCRGWGEGQE